MADEKRKSFWKENGPVLAALAVVGLLPFLSTLLTGRILFASDQAESYAWKPYFESAARGELMLWNPSAWPACPPWTPWPATAPTCPPSCWRPCLPITHFVSYNFILHVLVAGFSAFLLARRFFGLDSVFSLGLAAAYMLNTNFISHIHAGHTGKFYIMAWLPFSLYFLLRTLQPRRPLVPSCGPRRDRGLVRLHRPPAAHLLRAHGLLPLLGLQVLPVPARQGLQGAAALAGKFWIPVLLGIGIAFPVFYPPTQYNKLYSVRGEAFNAKAGRQRARRPPELRACRLLVHPPRGGGLPGGARVRRPQRDLLGAQLLQAELGISRPRHPVPGRVRPLRLPPQVVLVLGLGGPARHPLRPGGGHALLPLWPTPSSPASRASARPA